jgi:hypothetical protein
MSLDPLPVWLIFAGTIFLVLISTEAGYRLGRLARRRSEDEKEATVSGVASAILGLVAFMLAFTFGIVSDRFFNRLSLVREEANAVRTAYRRADFLPDLERGESRGLLREYVDLRLELTQAGSLERLNEFLSKTVSIQDRLWEVAVANARRDMNSDVGALYIESVNEIIEIQALRVAVGVQARIPLEIWFVLTSVTVLGMMALGYHSGIAGSNRSMSAVILALSFALVIAVIASLDRPAGFVQVSQQPLIDLRRSLSE